MALKAVILIGGPQKGECAGPEGWPPAPGTADPRSAPQAPGSGRCPSRCPSRSSPWPGCPWCSTTSRLAPRYGRPGLGEPGLPSPSAPSLVSPQVPGMKEILLMGFYQPHEALSRFLLSAQQEFKIPIRWGAYTHPGYPRRHSPEQPLTCLPRAGRLQLAPRHWAGGPCPTMGGQSWPSTLVLPSFPCPGPCSGSCKGDSPAQHRPPLLPSPVPMST